MNTLMKIILTTSFLFSSYGYVDKQGKSTLVTRDANGKIFVSDAEIKNCLSESNKTRSKFMCKMDIKRFKKKYDSHLQSGYPVVSKVKMKDIEDCMEEGLWNNQFDCEMMAFVYTMSELKSDYFLQISSQKKKDNSKKDLEAKRFAEYRKCLTSLHGQSNLKEYCLQLSKEKVTNMLNGCGLYGQTEGYCNGFHYKRSDSVMKDISRSLSGSPVLIKQKAPKETESVDVPFSNSDQSR